MRKCPICDYPAETNEEVLRRLDSDLLVRLSCDLAEHILDLTASPHAAARALATARNWKGNADILHQTAREAWQEQSICARRVDVENMESYEAAQAAAAKCMAYAVETASLAELFRHDAISRAAWVAKTAVEAANIHEGKWKAEEDWQQEHIRAVLCTCWMSHAVPPGERLRTSLLAH